MAVKKNTRRRRSQKRVRPPPEVKKSKRVAADAAARVLAEEGKPMSCGELIESMAASKYWSSPSGKTPASTLYAAIAREVNTKGTAARFKKTERGKFELRKTA